MIICCSESLLISFDGFGKGVSFDGFGEGVSEFSESAMDPLPLALLSLTSTRMSSGSTGELLDSSWSSPFYTTTNAYYNNIVTYSMDIQWYQSQKEERNTEFLKNSFFLLRPNKLIKKGRW